MKIAPIAAWSGALAGAYLMLGSPAALAIPGLVGSTVNLREGPGTTTPILGKIPGGSSVEVAKCSGEWCEVEWQGKKGYIIATSLGQGGAAPPSGAPPRGAPPPGGPPGAGYPGGPPPPPGYAGPPPPGYVYPPGYVPPPGYAPPPYYYPYGPYYYGYGPYWRRGWYRRHW